MYSIYVYIIIYISMKLFKKLSGGSGLVTFALALIIVFLAFLGVSYLLEKPPVVKDLKLTNISDSSVTVTYLTEEPTVGSVIVSTSNNFDIVGQFSKAKFYDDRGDGVARKTHHVTIKGMLPEALYYFRITSGFKNADVTYPNIETATTPDTLRTPDPSYARLTNQTNSDALVFYSLNNGTLQSTYLNSDSAFSIDKANIKTADLKESITYKEGDEINVTVVDAGGSTRTLKTKVGEDQPINMQGFIDQTDGASSTNLNKSLVGAVFAGACNERQYPERYCQETKDGLCCKSAVRTIKQKTDCSYETTSDGADSQSHDCNPKKPAEANKSTVTTDTNASNSGQSNEADKGCGSNRVVTYKKDKHCDTGKKIFVWVNEVCANGKITLQPGDATSEPCGELTTSQAGGLSKDGKTQTTQDAAKKAEEAAKTPKDVDVKPAESKLDPKAAESIKALCKGNTTIGKIVTDSDGCEYICAYENASRTSKACPSDLLDPVCKSKSSEIKVKTTSICIGNAAMITTDKSVDKVSCGSEVKRQVCTSEETCVESRGCVSNSSSKLTGDTKIAYENFCKNLEVEVIKCDDKDNKALYYKDYKGVYTYMSGDKEINENCPSAGGNRLLDIKNCGTTSHCEEGKGCQPNVTKPTGTSVTGSGAVTGTATISGTSIISPSVAVTTLYGGCHPAGDLKYEGKPYAPAGSTRVEKDGKIQDCCKFGSGIIEGAVKNVMVCSNYSRFSNAIVPPASAQAVLGTSDSTATEVKVDSTGKYKVTDVKGYQIVNSEVWVLDTGTANTGSLKFFEDKNRNSIKDEGEEYITTPLEVKVEKQSDVVKYEFVAGWNLISYNLAEGSTASKLISSINGFGGYATHVATYTTGSWMMYSERAGQKLGSDFKLVPGKGYFVKVIKPVTMYIEGKLVEKDQSIYLNTGWNLVGLRSTVTGAKNLIEEVNKTTALNLDTVTRLESGRYENLVSDGTTFYGNDFELKSEKGYFVRLKKGGASWKK